MRASHEIRYFIFALTRRLIHEPWFRRTTTSDSCRKRDDGRLKRTGLTPWALAAISLLSLVFIIVFTFFYRSAEAFLSPQSVTLLFITICCVGATAALLPSKCSRIFHQTQADHNRLHQSDSGDEPSQKRILWSGHHPTCGCYTAHVVQIRGKNYCAGCIGLLTGASLAIAGSLTYSLQIISVREEATPLFWVGSFLVLLGLLQYARPLMMNGWVHYLLNTIFVSGTFLLLVGVIEINGTLFVETYFLFTLFFWILARVALSNVEHQRICRKCESTLCMCRMK
jgi:energy-coupling factor transporter transmembrane protein EcfT